jgi:putative drug exporter of the RND superfamily
MEPLLASVVLTLRKRAFVTTMLYDMMSAMHVRRVWVSGIVLVAAVALLPFSFHAERHLETATRVEGSQAETVRQELADRFRSPFVDQVVLVIQGLPPADSQEGAQALEPIATALREQPGVSGVVSYLDSRDSIFLGRGAGTFVLVGLTSTDGPVELLVPKLHQLASSLENQMRGRYPAVKLELTGEIPLNFDIRKASSDDVQRGESLVIPATLALLLVAFGSLIAALIPLAVGQLATCQFWFRIWPPCSAWAWESTMHSSWLAASAKRFPPGTTDPQPQSLRHIRQVARS